MLKEFEKILSSGDKKILFVGIGNVLKSDDGTGVYICNRIKTSDRMLTLVVETGIENYIGKINSIEPDILVLVDCVEMKSPPGTVKLLTINEIQDLTFNTHNISLKRITEFFRMPLYILGVQPGYIGFGENISPEILHASDRIIQILNENVLHGFKQPADF